MHLDPDQLLIIGRILLHVQCRSVWSHPVLHSDASSPQSGPSLSFVSPALSAALEVVPQFYRRDILRSAMKQYGSTHTSVGK